MKDIKNIYYINTYFLYLTNNLQIHTILNLIL